MKTMLSEHTCYHPDNLKSDIKMQTTGAGRRWEARHRRQRLPQPVTAKWKPWPQSTERRTNTTGVGRGGSSSCQVCQSAPTHKQQCLHCLRSERNKQNLEAATIREGQVAASEEWAGAGRRDHGFSPQAFRAVSLTSITYSVFSIGLAKMFTQVFQSITEKLKHTFWPT